MKIATTSLIMGLVSCPLLELHAQYAGGSGDGYALVGAASNLLLDGSNLAAVYEGGDGDGYGLVGDENFLLDGSALAATYQGGAGDGYALVGASNLLLDGGNLAAIYQGGEDDGYALVEASNLLLDGGNLATVYGGGAGDGYGLVSDANFLLDGSMYFEEITNVGSDVEADFGNGLIVNFESVTSSGVTSLEISSSGPPPPSGFQIASDPPVYYDISTNASFMDTITVEINYDETQLGAEVAEADLKLLHEENGTFVDITTSLDTDQNLIAGETVTLSSFMIAAAVPTTLTFRVERTTGNVFADGSFMPGGADLAERINVSEPVEPGDVVELDSEKPHYFRKARANSQRVAGVITGEPGFILGNKGSLVRGEWSVDVSGQLLEIEIDERPMMALMGRVPVKVTTENGAIRPGDLLTVSSRPGYAMLCAKAKECEGVIVGKALEGLQSGEGMVAVLVTAR